MAVSMRVGYVAGLMEGAAAPHIEGDAVQVWRVDLDRRPPGVGELAHERERGDRMRDEQVRRRFLAGRTWLRAILAGHLGVDPGGVRFTVAERGKPSLVDGGDLCFSSSRSAGVGLVALTRDRPVGVDIEKIRSDLDHDDLARRFFSPGEAEALGQLPDGDRRLASFFGLWVRKEAVLKASGAGLADGLSHLDVRADLVDGRWSVASIEVGPGFAAAVAVDGALGQVTQHRPALAADPPLLR